jgi:hypothetical protein
VRGESERRLIYDLCVVQLFSETGFKEGAGAIATDEP